MAKVDYDVGIIGAGPAGSAMGAYLAKAGVSCVIFERDIFPRPHVGESLVPSSTRVFKELDFLDKMEEYKFPHKFGAVWTSTQSDRFYETNWEGLQTDGFADICFNERAQPGVDKEYTYHVDRGLFDLLLMQHAREFGAAVYQGVRIKKVDFSDPDHVTMRYDIGATEATTRVKMVVDASGRQTLLGVQEKLKVRDTVFDQYAIHTWFEDYDRTVAAQRPEQTDFIYIHFLPITNTWVWQIPITDRITSIGVVTQKKNFAASKESREQFFWDSIATRPELYEGLQAARRIRPFKDEGDYSYAMDQITGDRFVMVGDAARFVDPIFSTGVSIALNSARFASRDIIEALRTGDLSQPAFATYEATIRRGTKNWYDFITVYYRLNVLFTAFVQDKRYRLDVLKLLQGDVYDEAQPEVLRIMRETVAKVERNAHHPWHQLLGDLTNKAFQPA